MELKRILYTYYRIFYFLGFCPYIHELSSTNQASPSATLTGCRKIFCHLPLCAFTIFIVVTLIVGLQAHMVSFRLSHTLHQVMKHMFFPTEAICAIVVIGQCAFGKIHITKIIKSIIIVDGIIANELKTKPNYRKLKWSLFRCISLPISTFALSMFVMVLGSILNARARGYSLSLYCLQYPVIMSSVQIIIYTELVRFYLQTLNLYIKLNTQATTLNTDLLLGYRYYEKCKLKFVRQQMKIFKRIHICLWMVTEHINEYFGWSITADLFANIVDIIYEIHWIYLCHQNTESCNNPLDFGGSYDHKIFILID